MRKLPLLLIALFLTGCAMSPQGMIDQGDAASLHWPVGAPQPVELRAVCQANECMLVPAEGAYLYLRGP